MKKLVPAPKEYVQSMCALIGMTPEDTEERLRELIAWGYVEVVVLGDGKVAYLPGRTARNGV